VKVGDIVKWCIANNDDQPLIEFEYGTVIRLRTGEFVRETDPMDMALVLFTDGTQDWIRCRNLEVISEA